MALGPYTSPILNRDAIRNQAVVLKALGHESSLLIVHHLGEGDCGVVELVELVGGATALAGRLLGDVGVWGNRAVAAIFLVVGLHLLEVIPLPLPAARARAGRRGALILLAGFRLLW